MASLKRLLPTDAEAGGWNRIVPALLALGSVLLFIALASWSLDSPGLQYDEALFINGALGGITDSFVYHRLFGIPVMLMSYIGALKAYLFAPIFALLGVSIETIRGPAVLLSAVSVWLGYKVGEQTSGSRWIAALFALTMATDPIFVFMTRADYGPTVLMILIKLAALMALFKLLNTQESRYAWALSILLLLGLFDKLNFIWIVAALLLSAVIVYRKECLRLIRRRERSFLIATALLLLGLAVAGKLIVPLLWAGHVGPVDWAARLGEVRHLYQLTMNGQGINDMMLGAPEMPSPPTDQVERFVLIGLLLVVVLRLASAGIGRRRAAEQTESSPAGRRRRNLAFLVMLFGLVLLQLLLTREASGPHHIMALWPFHHLIMVQAIVVLLDSLGEGLITWPPRYFTVGRAVGSVLIGMAMLSVALLQLSVTRAYNTKFDAASRLPPIWTRSIYPLAEYISQAPDADAVICVDWGICNQVLALSPRMRAKNQDLWIVFAELEKNANHQDVFDRYFKDRRTLVIARVGDAVLLPAAYDNFTRFAARYLGNPTPSRLVADGDGHPVFAVYETSR